MNLIEKIREQSRKEVNVILNNGGRNIEQYTLVNNDGYTFDLEGIRCDARHWRNVYGAEVNVWEIHLSDESKRPVVRETIIKIEKELNELLRGE